MTSKSKYFVALLIIFVVILVTVITFSTLPVQRRLKNRLSRFKLKQQPQLDTFPDDFQFGVATSSYQVEGAWNADGKGLSIWDDLTQTESNKISNGSNANIAANSYYLYKRDVEMLRELGVDSYRFSISWTRIIPSGRHGKINELGIKYYNALIDELLANGITPFVTMYHWDLPQNLSVLRGWLNENIVDWFGDYARVLYQNFGDRVKMWITINDPSTQCYKGYVGVHPPLIKSPGFGYYECGRHMLLAHAKAYHIYNEEFRSEQGGSVGFAVNMEWAFPVSSSEDDSSAFLDYLAFNLDYYIHPIFSAHGNYPEIMIDKIAKASRQKGLNASRLRPFTNEQIGYLKGATDFFVLNTLHQGVFKYVYRNKSIDDEELYPLPSVEDDVNIKMFTSSKLLPNGFSTEYDSNLIYLLMYLNRMCKNTVIYVTQTSYASSEGLYDDKRVDSIRNELSSIFNAISVKVNVSGYFLWSLMDTFEWTNGYKIRYGLYEVDMADPDRTRIPRKSALIYQNIILNRGIDYNYDPTKIYQYLPRNSTNKTNNMCNLGTKMNTYII